jgi:hypothetical protein
LRQIFGYALAAAFTAAVVANRFTPNPTTTNQNGPSVNTAAIQAAVSKLLRDPSSARFGETDVYNDRAYEGLKRNDACGSVNAKNGFGGYSGEVNFTVFVDLYVAGIDPQRNNRAFVRRWNALCAGTHKPGSHTHLSEWIMAEF